MGEVLLARDLADDGTPVALKVLRPDFREVATPLFLREYVLQRKLNHPGIARVHELGFDRQSGSEVPYFAMQYLPGVPMERLMDQLPSLERIWSWMIAVLRALDHIHGAGYLHRDVKPGNILIDAQASDEEGVAHLIDFGITVPVASEPEEFFIGTPEYSAPERMAGAEFDRRSDLYSAGLILYELIEGEPPWPGSEPEELWVQRTRQPPRPFQDQQCPEGVRRLLFETLSPRVEERPGSAGEMIVRLCNAIGREPVIETPSAFRMRLEAAPVWSHSYRELMQADARMLVMDVGSGHDGHRLFHEIADSTAVKGVRVVRVKLEGTSDQLMAELEPALDVFRRLRAARAPAGEPVFELPGPAGAATMLTRMHRPTLLCIQDLQRADAHILGVLNAVFTGAANPNLRLLATVNNAEQPRCAKGFAHVMASSYVTRKPLLPFTEAETAAFITTVLGPEVIDPPGIGRLHADCAGSPLRLVGLLSEAFQRRDICRTYLGYLWAGQPLAGVTSGSAGAATAPALIARLSLMRSPIPAGAARRYLADVADLDDLLSAGIVMATSSGWVVCGSGFARHRAASDLSEAQRKTLHQKLAEALMREPGFIGRSRLIADQLVKTQRPAQAIPLLLSAAAEAFEAHQEVTPKALIDQAASLLGSDEIADESAWRWAALVHEANIKLARNIGDDERLSAAADALFELGAEKAHLGSLERALVAKMDHACGSGDWRRLVQHAEQLLIVQQQGSEAAALHAWANAMRAWHGGELREALRLVEHGIGLAGCDNPTTHLKLVALRADLAVGGGEGEIADRALSDYAIAAANAQSVAAIARAGVSRAALLRHQGQVSLALACVQSVSAEVGARHRRGLNGLIEAELAECHLALGWSATAEEHAIRAIDLAALDHDPAVVFAARSALAEALLSQGQAVEAARLMRELLANVPPQVMPPARFQAACRALSCRLQLAESVEALIRDAESLAKQALASHLNPWAVRAAAVAVRAALRAHRSRDALGYAEWLEAMAEEQPVGGLPEHSLLWLLGCAHYQLKSFSDAGAMARRALASLRATAQELVADDHRSSWLAVGDNPMIVSGNFEGLGKKSARVAGRKSSPLRRKTRSYARQPLLKKPIRQHP